MKANAAFLRVFKNTFPFDILFARRARRRSLWRNQVEIGNRLCAFPLKVLRRLPSKTAAYGRTCLSLPLAQQSAFSCQQSAGQSAKREESFVNLRQAKI